ncbi:MAG: LpqN/LpqT family lipoprotein [Actinomycetota bacterium]|nr:LpqN/LpqT family lipoprotein [Actinomycetota bacterium]
MIEIVPAHRALLGGVVAGLIGLAVVAGGTASADPLPPAPAPAPTVPAPAPQNLGPELVPPSRYLAAPPAANQIAPRATAPVPATTVPAAVPPAVPAAVPAAAPVPATSGTIHEFLQSKGVKLEAQKPQGFNALDITLPMPPRWSQVPDPNVPDAFAVIADRHGSSIYSSNAQVVVYKLVGAVDPREAITHGYVDSQKLLAWQPTNASMADFGGFPSSVVEGTYRDGDLTLNTSRRHVIATSGHDKYLVSLSVTTDRAVSVADAPATDAIINGFRVSAPGAAAPAPPQAPAASPVGLPAQPPAATPVAPAAPAPAAVPVSPAPAVAPAAPAAPAPGAAPLVPLAQTSPAAPVGLPAQAPAANPQRTPSLLAMLPGLPPLPNFSFLQH